MMVTGRKPRVTRAAAERILAIAVAIWHKVGHNERPAYVPLHDA